MGKRLSSRGFVLEVGRKCRTRYLVFKRASIEAALVACRLKIDSVAIMDVHVAEKLGFL